MKNYLDISKKIQEYMEAYNEAWGMSGTVLVAKEGEVLFEKAYGYADLQHQVLNATHTKFNIASITKSFTAVAIMILQERGLLNVEDRIIKYLPEYPEFDRGITVHHLLSHTSGIKNENELPDFFTKLKKLPFTQEEFIGLFKEYPLDFQPGEKFKYCNSGYYLLGVIIEKVSGKSFESFIREEILEKLNMKDTQVYNQKNIVPNKASGYELDGDKLINDPYSDWTNLAPSGGIISTVRDMMKWDEALYSNSILSDKARDMIFTDYSENYGYGWEIEEAFNRKRYSHNGAHNGFICQMYRYPEEKICIILLCNHRYINVGELCDNISSIVFGEEVVLPMRPEKVQLERDICEGYTGLYKDPEDDFVITVTYEDETMYMQFDDDSRFEIYPISERRFNNIKIDEKYKFLEKGLEIYGYTYYKINS